MREASGTVRRLTIAALLLVALAMAACAGAASEASPQAEEAALRDAARVVRRAFESKDGAALASLAHPDKGVRFSPYAYVDVEGDVALTPAELERFWTDTSVRTWGTEDGTGDPIQLTPTAYCAEYVLDRDFSGATLSVDDDQAEGNTVNNANAAYPQGRRVEFYVEGAEVDGDPVAGEPMGGTDWGALRLVFEQVDGEWRLVGVIHDEWTI